MSQEADQQFLQQALRLAQRSFGLASPNPNVGALLVDAGGRVVGEGFYTYDGVKHAEVQAIEQAAGKARGATLCDLRRRASAVPACGCARDRVSGPLQRGKVELDQLAGWRQNRQDQ